MNEYLLVICLSNRDADQARLHFIENHKDEITAKPANRRIIIRDKLAVDFVSMNNKAAFDGRKPRDILFTKAALAKGDPKKIYALISNFQLIMAIAARR